MGGDPKVQEELVKMLRAGVSKEKSKERLREDVRKIAQEEAERLKRATEEAKKEVDRLQQLMQDRSSLEFGSALADINQSADEFEEELRKSRAEMESKQAEFQAWERKVMREKSMGQFFQSLYDDAKATRADRNTKQSLQPPAAASLFDGEVQPTTRAMREAAASEVRRPMRMYIFMFMSLNLSALCCADLLSESPALLSDLTYVLVAIFLGVAALAERQHLLSQEAGDSDHA